MKFNSHGVLAAAVALGSVVALTTAAMAAQPARTLSSGGCENTGGAAQMVSSMQGSAAGRQGASRGNGLGSSQSDDTQANGPQFRQRGLGFMQEGTSGGQNVQNRLEERAADMESAISSAIANLSDEDAATLSTYISAYEKAVAAETDAASSSDSSTDLTSYREAVKDAVDALLAAAKDADINLDLGQCESGIGPVWSRIQNGSSDLETLLSSLSDDDKATLSEYIDAVENAVAAENDAVSSADKNTDMSSYRKAVMNAVKALFEAAKDANISLGDAVSSAE